jgi:hypothetical protein
MTTVCYTGQPNRDFSVSNLAVDNEYVRQNLTVNGIIRARRICVQFPDPGPPGPQGPAGPILQIVRFNSGANVTNNNFLVYCGQTATETQAQEVMPISGTLNRLFVDLVTAPGGAASRTFTLRLNGVATALAVTVSAATTTANNTSDTVSFVAGDLISIQHVATGGPAASVARASFVVNSL